MYSYTVRGEINQKGNLLCSQMTHRNYYFVSYKKGGFIFNLSPPFTARLRENIMKNIKYHQ